jgi:formamidopyrimidine-DNA glycosylase
MDRWPERLGGRAVRAVDAHGKHLFIRFEGDLTLHSHLRPCRRCGTPIAARGQGDDNRTTYWCPRCQA